MKLLELLLENNNVKLQPITPNRFVYHKSNPIFRDSISKQGIIPKGKSDAWLSNTPISGKVIFATNSDNEKDWFDSMYDDDVYRIDTRKINNIWYIDPNFQIQNYNKHIITFDKIPVSAITLLYKGTGDSIEI
jgi:hypothetical protein